MTGEYESLKKVLSTIEVEEGLNNKDNIIKKIQEELKRQDQGRLYQEWEKGEFDVNHGFSLNISGIEYSKLLLLIIAAQNGYTKTVEILLEKGAHVNEKDCYGYTALHLAAKNGHEGIVEILLEKGAHVNEKSRYGITPLHLAAKNGHEGIVEILLEKGAHVNEKDWHGYTALHLAARNGHTNIVKALIQAGVDVNAVDGYGKTPLDRAECYAKKCAEEHGKIYDKDYANSKNVVEALLKAGGGSFVKALNKAMIAGGATGLLGTAIAVALFTTGTITSQLIPIVIAVVAVIAAVLVVGYATYELLKPSTKVGEVEKPIVNLTNEQQEAAI